MPPSTVVLVRVATLPFEALEPLAAHAARAPLTALLAAERALDEEGAAIGDALYALAGPGGGAPTSRHALLALRRDVHNRRAPGAASAAALEVLPAALRERVGRHTAATARLADRRALALAALESDLRAGHAALLALAARPLVAEGLWLASRSLLERVRRLDPAGGPERGEARFVAGKVLAYVTRFATKTSPNGVFCATALGGFGARAALAGAPGIARVEVRLGVGEARKVAACLAVDPALEPLVAPRLNPTLRRDGEGWTWWKPATPRAGDDDEVRSKAPDSPALGAFVEACADGAPGVPALLDAVAARLGGAVERPALRAFLDKLVAAGVLIAEVEIPWSEPRPLAALARRCRAADLAPAWVAQVERLEATLDETAALDPSRRPAALAPALAALEALPHARPLEPDAALRVDAASALRVTLPHAVRDELERVVEEYARLYAALYPPRAFLARWVRRFLAAHPADTDVPALALYHGVFDDDARERVTAFPAPGADEPAAREVWERLRERFAGDGGGDEVRLAPGQLAALGRVDAVPRFACGVLFQLDAPDLAALDAGGWRACLNAIYPGAGLAFSRFARLHGGDGAADPIADELRRGHAWLARPDAHPAEISYMHGGRTANAGLRPPLLPLEIELPGDRASEGREALTLGDLVVRYESASGAFRLRSRRLGVDVLPLVSSGIDPEGFVAFLIEIGRQGTQPLAFFNAFERADALDWPRVTLGRVVLSRRRWVVPADALAAVVDARAGDAARVLEFARLRERRALPRHVFAHSEAEPRPRYVDLDSPVAVARLARELAAAGPAAPPRLHVTEMLPGPDGLWVRDPGGGYATEFLLHVRRPRGRDA